CGLGDAIALGSTVAPEMVALRTRMAFLGERAEEKAPRGTRAGGGHRGATTTRAHTAPRARGFLAHLDRDGAWVRPEMRAKRVARFGPATAYSASSSPVQYR